MTRIILASASPRRRELLQQMGLRYEMQVSGIDEAVLESLPARERVMTLAQKKAETIAARNPDALVIGADTIVVLGNQVLEKPTDETDALAMLTMLSGRCHSVLTGLSLVGPGIQKASLHCEETQVYFRDLDKDEIHWYIRSGEYADKAGAYGIQGKAALFVNRIEGCYFNVVGLPLTALFLLLKERGIHIENHTGS